MTNSIPHLGDPADQSLKEYIVTLKNIDDANDFYTDIESPGGSLYIPKRQVECTNRRPISRNTHYNLTYDEAAEILNDSRVESVTLNSVDLNVIRGPYGFAQYSSNFDKRVASDNNDINWGLLRCVRKTDINSWGITGTFNQTASIIIDASGKNVDVVVMDDGCPYPTTLEYAQNVNGTGYSRMVEYNWYRHNPEVSGAPVGEYNYSSNRLQEHGAHTTGTCIGNTQGWARDANVYNITFYDDIDYVREFHRTKPVNPLTGLKNPTIMNNSWGYRLSSWSATNITQIYYRGVLYTKPPTGWTTTQLNQFRIRTGYAIPIQDAPTDADMIDAMSEGIIIVASAGNSAWYVDVPGGPDYNNYLVIGGVSYYYHRGSSPGSANGGTEGTKIICSGAIGQHNESTGASIYSSTGLEIGDYRAEFSNYGPRIDCYAPGSAIQSIWTTGESLYDSIEATDLRVTLLGETDVVNNNFKKVPGTSMSGPQTAGVLACLAEKYPRMTQADARALLNAVCTETVLSTNGGTFDDKDAGFGYNPDSCKKMLFYPGNRNPSQEVGGFHKTPTPTVNNWFRPTSGQTYPRLKTFNSHTPSTFSLQSDASSVVNGSTVTLAVHTTGIPNGTTVPYIITARPQPQSTLITTATSGVFSTDTPVYGVNLDTRPNSGNRFTTTGVINGTSQSIPNLLVGPASLQSSTPYAPGALIFTGSEDDGYWTIPLPFSITICGASYNTIYVGTNTYITFGGGSLAYFSLGSSNPPYRKIMISSADNSCQRIYYGEEGAVPNRTFRVRWEGTSRTSGTLGSPNMVYEVVFYENAPTQVDVHTGVNARWYVGSTVYPLSVNDLSVPLTGNITINSNLGILPVTIATSEQMYMNVRLGVFPSPNVTINVN